MFSKKTRNLAVTVLAFLMAITLGFGVIGFNRAEKVSAASVEIYLASKDTTATVDGSNVGNSNFAPTSSDGGNYLSMTTKKGYTKYKPNAGVTWVGDGNTFTEAHIPSGSTDSSNPFTFTAKVAGTITIYYTITDSSALKAGNVSSGNVVCDVTSTNVAPIKVNNGVATAGKLVIELAESATATVYTTGGRFAIFAIYFETAGSQGGDTSSSESGNTEPEPEIPPVVAKSGTVYFTTDEASLSGTGSSNRWLSTTQNGYTVYYGRTGGSITPNATGSQLNNNNIYFAFKLTEPMSIVVDLNFTGTSSSGLTLNAGMYKLADGQVGEIDKVAGTTNTKSSVTLNGSTAITPNKIMLGSNELAGDTTPLVIKEKCHGEFYYTLEAGEYAYRTTNSTSSTYLYGITFTPIAKTYIVTFDNNGTKKVKTVLEGETVEEFIPEAREGYVFHGWHRKDGTHFDFDTPVYADLELEAVWYETGKGTEITEFEGASHSQDVADATERLLNGTYTVAYKGESRSALRNMITTEILPQTITAKAANGETIEIDLNWVHSIRDYKDFDFDEVAPIVGTHTYIAVADVPEGYYTTLWLRAIVEVEEGREQIDSVEEELTYTVTEGTDLSAVLPDAVKVKTVNGNVVTVDVTWEYPELDAVVAGTIYVKGIVTDIAFLPEGFEVLATVIVKGATVNVEVNNIFTWDARNETRAVSDFEDYLVGKSDDGKVIVTVSSTVTNGTQNAGGNAMNIGKSASAYIKIVVSVNAKISIRSGAEGTAGERNFVFNTSETDYTVGIVGEGSTKTNAAGAFDNDDANHVVSVNVEAGTYYIWNKNSNAAQVYEIKVDEIITTEGYYFEANETLFEEDMLPVQEGYTFVGWVTPSADAILAGGVAATEEGHYSPLYVKVTMTTSVKIGTNGGIKFTFTAEFINGDSLTDEAVKELVNVTLTVTGNKTAVVENANYVYENGKLVSSAIITGWTAETAPTWREVPVKASITLSFNGIEKTFAGEEALSAKDVATRFASEYPELAEQYAEELEMYIG